MLKLYIYFATSEMYKFTSDLLSKNNEEPNRTDSPVIN